MLRLLSFAIMLMLSALPGPAAAAGHASARAPGVVVISAPAHPTTGPSDAVTADADAPGVPWPWPVAGVRRVVEPFRAPAHDYGPGHRGIDIAAAPLAEVRAPAAGVVAFRGTVVDRPLVTIDHGDGYVTTWEPVASPLSPGEAVEPGQAIGTIAQGGHAPRGTLHVGLRVDGEYVNPLPLFGEIPRAILLPCCE